MICRHLTCREGGTNIAEETDASVFRVKETYEAVVAA
jgi:hypothetical protein